MIDVKPIEGYNKDNYRKDRGIANINEDKISAAVVEQMMDAILEGWSYAYINNSFNDVYHWNSYQTKFIYNAAVKEILDKSTKQSENLKEKQLQRLLKLYRKCELANDRAGELKVLAEINKLNSLYIDKLEVTNNEAVFKIDGEEE